MNSPRSELRDWYTRRLRPKVLEAARSGEIAPAHAAELERQMNNLLASRKQERPARSTPT